MLKDSWLIIPLVFVAIGYNMLVETNHYVYLYAAFAIAGIVFTRYVRTWSRRAHYAQVICGNLELNNSMSREGLWFCVTSDHKTAALTKSQPEKDQWIFDLALDYLQVKEKIALVEPPAYERRVYCGSKERMRRIDLTCDYEYQLVRDDWSEVPD
jgi:hypothetical protein